MVKIRRLLVLPLVVPLVLPLVFLAGLAPGCSDPRADDPAQVFHDLSEALEEGRPLAFLDMLPDSCFAAGGSLVRAFAERMDAEVWDAGVRTVRKLALVLQEKHELLLANPMLAMLMVQVGGGSQARLEAMGDALEALADSEAATLEGLARLDLHDFLESTVGLLLAQLDSGIVRAQGPTALHALGLGWLSADFTTTTERHGEENATVSIQGKGGATERFEMTLIGGKWVPGFSEDEWPDLAEARSRIEAFTLAPERKQQILAGMFLVEAVLNQVLAAEDPEDLNAAFDGVMQALGSF